MNDAQAMNGSAPSLLVPPALIDAIAAAVAARIQPPSPPPPADDALAITRAEAAERLSMSIDHLERHVLPELRTIVSGRLRLVPVSELERWVERSAARALEKRR